MSRIVISWFVILLSKVFSLCHNDSGVTHVIMGIAITVGFYYSRDLVVIRIYDCIYLR